MIRTERLLLRQFTENDAEDLYTVISTQDVLRYFPPGPSPTRETAEKMISRIQTQWIEDGYGLWAVEFQGNVVGRTGLQLIPETGETEIDFILAPRYWGRGLATEAGRACLGFGFERLAIREIVGITHPDNKASRRVLGKLGMTHTGHAEYFGMGVERYAIDEASWIHNRRSTLD
jgi:RimJ/RimL family protein N-acetyltransferase